MNQMTKIEAQARADQIHAFRRELAALAAAGLRLEAPLQASIEQHQDALLGEYAGRFDIDRDARARQLSLGMRVASFLGALALAAAVFFLFYQFWGVVPTAVQITIVLAASLASLAVTAWLHGRDDAGYFTKLAALVAFACFVLNIVVLGQVFNITPSDKALLPWGAYAFLLAYRCDLRLLLVAGILCVVGWIAARTGTICGMYWLHFGERPENFFPAALLLFCLPLVLVHRRRSDFAPVYRLFGLLTFLLPVLVLANWGQISYLPGSASVIEGGYQLVGFAVSALAIWLGARRGWNEVSNTGTTFFVVFLYTKLFDWWWEIMPKSLFFLLLAMIAVLLLLVFRRLRDTRRPTLAGAGP